MSEETFPDRLRIRDTRLHDDMGGAGQRIYTTAGQGYTKVEYVRADLHAALRAKVEQLKKDVLRQMAWKTEAQDELEDICNELPGVAFMDPPDGGSVTVAEQVRRMYAALLARDAQVMGLKKYIKHNHGCAAISWREGAVHCTCGLDAVLTGEPGQGGENE